MSGKFDIAIVMPPPWSVIAPPIAPYLLRTVLATEDLSAIVFDLNTKLYRSIDSSERGLWDLGAMEYWWRPALFEKLLGEKHFQKTIAELCSIDTEIIGFSVNSTNIVFTTLLIDHLKRIGLNRKIVLGGPGVQPNTQDAILRFPLLVHCYRVDDPFVGFTQALEELYESCDALVCGEAEYSLGEVIRRFKGGGAATIDGVFFTGQSGLFGYKQRDPISDLDALPFPRYDGSEYWQQKEETTSIHLLGARGCVRRCLFCTENRLWHHFRTRSAEHIVAEIVDHVENYGVRQFGFVDLLLNGNLKVLERFCDLVIERRLDLKLNGNMIVHPKMTDRSFRKLKQAGFTHVMVGIESGSDRVLKAMKKGFSAETAARFLASCAKYGVRPITNFVIGFPAETEEDFQATLDFVALNARFIDQIGVVDTCIFYRSSELFERRDLFGVELDDPTRKPGAIERWKNPATGDYIDRFDRLLRFIDECRGRGLGYAARTAMILGDIELVLGFDRILGEEKRRRIAEMNGHARQHCLKIFLPVEKEHYLVLLHYLVFGTVHEKEVCFNHLLLNFDPELGHFYHLLFSERLFPLSFGQYSSKESLVYLARKFKQRIAGHLILLLHCSDPYLTFLAGKCLSEIDFCYCITHLSAELADKRFGDYSLEVRYGLADLKRRFDAWISGNALAYFDYQRMDQDEIERRTKLAIETIGEANLSDHDLGAEELFLVGSYLSGQDIDRDAIIRMLLLQSGQLDTPLASSILDEWLVPLPRLHVRTLDLIIDRYRDGSLGDQGRLIRLIRCFERLIENDEILLNLHGEFLFTDELNRLLLEEEMDGPDRLGSDLLPGVDDPLTGRERQILAKMGNGAAWEKDAALHLAVLNYDPDRMDFYDLILTERLFRLDFGANRTRERVADWATRFGRRAVKHLEILLHCSDPYFQLIAAKSLMQIDFRFGLDHHFQILHGPAYFEQPPTTKYLLFREKLLFERWFEGDLIGFRRVFGTSDCIDGSTTAPFSGSALSIGGADPENLREIYLSAREIEREILLRKLLGDIRPENVHLIENLFREEDVTLPYLQNDSLELLFGQLETNDPSRLGFKKAIRDYFARLHEYPHWTENPAGEKILLERTKARLTAPSIDQVQTITAMLIELAPSARAEDFSSVRLGKDRLSYTAQLLHRQTPTSTSAHALALLFDAYKPDLSAFYNIVCREQLGSLTLLPLGVKRSISTWAKKFGNSCREHLEILLDSSDRAVQFQAFKSLCRLDFRYCLTNFKDLFSDVHYRQQDQRTRAILYNEKTAFDAFGCNRPDIFFRYEELEMDVRIGLLESGKAALAKLRPKIALDDNYLLVLAFYLQGNPIEREICLRGSIFDQSGQSDIVLTLIFEEALGPLPDLTEESEALLIAGLEGDRPRLISWFDRIVAYFERRFSGTPERKRTRLSELEQILTLAGEKYPKSTTELRPQFARGLERIGLGSEDIGSSKPSWFVPALLSDDLEFRRAAVTFSLLQSSAAETRLCRAVFSGKILPLSAFSETMKEAVIDWAERIGSKAIPLLDLVLDGDDDYLRFIATKMIMSLDPSACLFRFQGLFEPENYRRLDHRTKSLLFVHKYRYDGWVEGDPLRYYCGKSSNMGKMMILCASDIAIVRKLMRKILTLEKDWLNHSNDCFVAEIPATVCPGQALSLMLPQWCSNGPIYLAVLLDRSRILHHELLPMPEPAQSGGKSLFWETPSFPCLLSGTTRSIDLIFSPIEKTGEKPMCPGTFVQPISIAQKPGDGGGAVFCPTIATIEQTEKTAVAPAITHVGFERSPSSEDARIRPARISIELITGEQQNPLVRIQIFQHSDKKGALLLYGMNSARLGIALAAKHRFRINLDIASLALRPGDYRLIVEIREDETPESRHIAEPRCCELSLTGTDPAILFSPLMIESRLEWRDANAEDCRET